MVSQCLVQCRARTLQFTAVRGDLASSPGGDGQEWFPLGEHRSLGQHVDDFARSL